MTKFLEEEGATSGKCIFHDARRSLDLTGVIMRVDCLDLGKQLEGKGGSIDRQYGGLWAFRQRKRWRSMRQ